LIQEQAFLYIKVFNREKNFGLSTIKPGGALNMPRIIYGTGRHSPVNGPMSILTDAALLITMPIKT
jgi:hypothetical protein